MNPLRLQSTSRPPSPRASRRARPVVDVLRHVGIVVADGRDVGAWIRLVAEGTDFVVARSDETSRVHASRCALDVTHATRGPDGVAVLDIGRIPPSFFSPPSACSLAVAGGLRHMGLSASVGPCAVARSLADAPGRRRVRFPWTGRAVDRSVPDLHRALVPWSTRVACLFGHHPVSLLARADETHVGRASPTLAGAALAIVDRHPSLAIALTDLCRQRRIGNDDPAALVVATACGLMRREDDRAVRIGRLLQASKAMPDLSRSLGPLSDMLAHLPPDWCPRDEGALTAASSLALVLHEASRDRVLTLPLFHGKVRLNSGGRWREFRGRLDGRCEAGLSVALHGVQDMLVAFEKSLVLPYDGDGDDVFNYDPIQRRRTIEVAIRTLFGDKGLPAILEASDEWHRTYARPKASGEDLRWEPLLPDFTLGDVAVKVLCTGDQLAEEGGRDVDGFGVRGLWHCVATYDGACHSNGQRILSVRRVRPDGTYARLSTARLLLDRRPAAVSVVEHRGRRNAAPPRQAVRAVEAYVEYVRASPGIMALVEATPVGGISGRDVDPRAEFEAWKPFLARDVRKRGLAAYVDAVRADLASVEAKSATG